MKSLSGGASLALRSGFLVVAVLSSLFASRAAFALSIGYGDLGSSTNQYAWPVRLINDITSTHTVTSILLDASTSSYGSYWYWTSPVLSGASQSTYTSISGVNTQQLMIDFSGNALDPGDYLVFQSIFPDDGIPMSPLIPSNAALGARATFTFDDYSVWVGEFTSVSPSAGSVFPDGLYTLRQQSQDIPEPETIMLFALGLTLLLLPRRRNHAACCHA